MFFPIARAERKQIIKSGSQLRISPRAFSRHRELSRRFSHAKAEYNNINNRWHRASIFRVSNQRDCLAQPHTPRINGINICVARCDVGEERDNKRLSVISSDDARRGVSDKKDGTGQASTPSVSGISSGITRRTITHILQRNDTNKRMIVVMRLKTISYKLP